MRRKVPPRPPSKDLTVGGGVRRRASNATASLEVFGRRGLGGRHRRSLTLAIAVCRVPREEATDHRQGNPRPRRSPKGGSPQFFSPLVCCRFWDVRCATGHLQAIVQRVPGLSLLGVYRACSKAMHDLHDLHGDFPRNSATLQPSEAPCSESRLQAVWRDSKPVSTASPRLSRLCRFSPCSEYNPGARKWRPAFPPFPATFQESSAPPERRGC